MPLRPLAPRPAGTIFGRQSVRATRRAPRGPSQSVAQFRAPQRPILTGPHQGYSVPVTVPRGHFSPDLRALFLGGSLTAIPLGQPEAPRKALPYSKPRGGHTQPPSTKVIAHPSWHPGHVWPSDLWALFLDGALPTTTPWRLESPRKALLNHESRGGHTMPPHTKAIAHPPRGPEGVWYPDLRALFLGAALPTTTPGASRPLAKPCPFRVPRRPRPPASTKVIAHPSWCPRRVWPPNL